MIQEIYDYLWIRNYLIALSSDELIDDIKKNNSFEEIINILSNLMQEEDFILTDPSLQRKISSIILEFRFDYNHKKEINDNINYIINRLNEYKSMSDDRKNMIIKEFYLEEWKKRNLPFIYKPAISHLDNFIASDCQYFLKTFFEYTDEEKQETVIYRDELMNICAMANLITNKFPEFYENLEVRECALDTIKGLKGFKKLPLLAKSYLKTTENNLKKLEKVYK